ncbi:putative integral membrane protein [Paramyrothecium foliicola]|nr:putative integral membrane protein [Paramyrothecium foliicola]
MDETVPDVDRAASFIAIFTAQCALATVVVVLRFWARYHIHNFGWDDLFMLLTWILFVALTGISVVIAVNGGTRHMFYLGDKIGRVVRLIYIAQPFGIMSVALGKISAGFLILRLLGNTYKWMRMSIWVIIVITAIANIISAITTFTQCDPPAALWNLALRPTAHCWDPSVQSNYNIFTSSWNTAVDFVLALMPIRLVWGLKLNVRQRIGIIVLLGVGVFSGVCSAIKTTQLASLTERSDLTWETYSLFLWVSSELFVIVLCASIATLKPLYDRFFGKKSGSTIRSTSGGYMLSGSTSSRSKIRTRNDEFGPHIPLSDMSESPEAKEFPRKGHGVYKGDMTSVSGKCSSTHQPADPWSNSEQKIRVTQTIETVHSQVPPRK